MKCTRHPFDGGVGVCASCLRERLLALSAPPQVASSPEHHHGKPSRAADAGSRRSSVLFGNHGPGDRDRGPQRSSSWLSAVLRFLRKNKMSRLLSADDVAPAPGRDRGLSTESSRDGGPEPEGWWKVESPYRSWRPKPAPAPAPAKHHHPGVGDLAGFAVCCSPMVTLSSSRRRSRGAEIRFSGEMPRAALGPHHRRHASTGGLLMWPDRSRKLDEFVTLR